MGAAGKLMALLRRWVRKLLRGTPPAREQRGGA